MPGLPNDTGSLPNDAGGLPNSTGSASAAAFPATATLHAAGYAKGVSGAMTRSDGPGVDCPIFLELETKQGDAQTYADQGDAEGDRVYYLVRLPGPDLATAGQLAAIVALKHGDSIVTSPANFFPSMTLLPLGPVFPILAGRMFQLRCRRLT